MTEPFQLFDMLPPHIEDALRASIERFGVLVPVTVDQGGTMLDGHHRARIADELGVPYDRLVRHCADDDERREVARTLNTARRHLSGEQLREHIVMLAQRTTPNGTGELSQPEIAKLAGISQPYVNQTLSDPQVISTYNLPDSRRGADGKVYPARRPQVFARDDREQERAQAALELIAPTAEPTQSLSVVEARQAVARQRAPESVTVPIPLPDGKFSCIVADPPWPIQKIETMRRPDQGVELDYPVMSLEDIAALPVGDMAADDCHLYLWVTHKFLPAGLELMEQWGFRYQCVMTWWKHTGVSPYSWMYDTEHVLFGRRGNLPLLKMGMRLYFDAPNIRNRHSAKPDVFYERVAAASPGPRLEMFARTPRDGFTVWGNEVADVVRG